jgi:hypothetical protein
VQPSGQRGDLRLVADSDILGSISEGCLEATIIRSSPGLPNKWLWWVGLCIWGLLPCGESKGPYLGEVTCH